MHRAARVKIKGQELLFKRAPPDDYFCYRCNNRRYYFKKVVLKNFSEFTGKNLCQVSFLTKLQGFNRTPLDDCFYY